MSSGRPIIAICMLLGRIAITVCGPFDGQLPEDDIHESKSEETSSKYPDKNDVCSTPECVLAASRFLNDMDRKVEPCDDFYQFVCGNYEKSARINDDYFYAATIYLRFEEAYARLQRIIEDIDESTAPAVFLNITSAYKSCLENKWYNTEEPSVDESQRDYIVGLWKKIRQERENELYLSIYDFNPQLFSTLYYQSEYNRSQNVLHISLKQPVIAWAYLKEGLANQVVREYLMFMKNVGINLGADQRQVDSDLLDVLNFEVELAKIVSPENEDEEDKFYHDYTEMTLKQLKRFFPHLRFERASKNMTDTSKFQTQIALKTLKKLDELIAQKSTLVLANWALWRKTVEKTSGLGQVIRHKHQSLIGHDRTGAFLTDGVTRECVKEVRSAFPFVLNVLYYGQFLSEDAVKSMEAIFANTKAAFIESMKKATWLSDFTKQQAIEKVESTGNRFGFFEKFMLNRTLNSSSADLKLSEGFLAANRANITAILNNFNKRYIEELDFMDYPAFYVPKQRYVGMGALLFSDVMHDTGHPASLNYGGFGATVAHEIMHGFDHVRKWYDQTGNMRLEPWWDVDSLKNYAARTRCLENQHRKYASDELGLDVTPSRTRDEDLADLVGTRMAYSAYVELAKDSLPEKQLPGLDYSPRQMFWISTANTACVKTRPVAALRFLYEEEHSLPKLRINVPLSNLQEFADDFNCAVGSKMNPKDKCTIW
ncbi:endothelin-converting enzyme homolog [Venturia canescens]|uniref:endothelin-converting enzyme homolog n=1 Tax=Venturia canescens TaxID=32260 RepID=UPI001C9CA6AE|nr:endothelin-converting enzyme homolog [Venturia canescens]